MARVSVCIFLQALQKFVKDVKWAHIDIAGIAFLDKPQKELIAGASGAGVRTLLNYILEQ